jgi:hypothetical protein
MNIEEVEDRRDQQCHSREPYALRRKSVRLCEDRLPPDDGIADLRKQSGMWQLNKRGAKDVQKLQGRSPRGLESALAVRRACMQKECVCRA